MQNHKSEYNSLSQIEDNKNDMKDIQFVLLHVIVYGINFGHSLFTQMPIINNADLLVQYLHYSFRICMQSWALHIMNLNIATIFYTHSAPPVQLDILFSAMQTNPHFSFEALKYVFVAWSD